MKLRLIFVCAFCAIALLFDTAGLFRLLLLCSFVHEMGHIIAYTVFTHRIPRLQYYISGVSLMVQAPLSSWQELIVLCAGPFMNFVFACFFYGLALYQARYSFYFLAAVSLCVGLYNLLPVGVLDGARILQNICSAKYLPSLEKFETFLLLLVCCICLWVSFQAAVPTHTRVAALLAPTYQILQKYKR